MKKLQAINESGRHFNAGGRHWLIMALLICLLGLLLARLGHLYWVESSFLKAQGDARIIRTVKLAAHRGQILDRHGAALAVDAPVSSVWAHPALFKEDKRKWSQLAEILAVSTGHLQQLSNRYANRRFMYLKRHLSPNIARQVKRLNIKGVYLQQEYKRFYPTAEVSAQLVGLTNIDNHGQEGLELAFDAWLSGQRGAKRVIKNRIGQVIEDLAVTQIARAGGDLSLSIDLKLQFLAYKELKRAVNQYDAVAGSIVIMDVQTAEVLAMVNQSSFNPNLRKSIKLSALRNRAVIDVFEPGSAVKPLAMAWALASGRFTASSIIDTSPGSLSLAGGVVRDPSNYGRMDLAAIIQHSSNVGISKIIITLPATGLWRIYAKFGFGSGTSSGFPGERLGFLTSSTHWSPHVLATHAFGYGMSVTALQLAHAYTILGALGLKRPVSLVKLSSPLAAERIIQNDIAQQILDMMELAVEKGTGRLAQVDGFRVAGKTGTARLAEGAGYGDDYNAVFVGLAPASDPRLSIVVVINKPKGEDYHGGEIAAPVFAKVMGGALRQLNIQPDGQFDHSPRLTMDL